MVVATSAPPRPAAVQEHLKRQRLAILRMRMAFRRAVESCEMAELAANAAYSSALVATGRMRRVGQLLQNLQQLEA